MDRGERDFLHSKIHLKMYDMNESWLNRLNSFPNTMRNAADDFF